MTEMYKNLMLHVAFLGWVGLIWAGESPEPVFQPDLEQGQVLYQKYCEECHGNSGRGDGPRAALLAPRPGNLVSAATSSKSDQELLEIIEQGIPRTAMRGWGTELSAEERRNVLAFVRSLVHFRDQSQTPPPP